MAQLARIIEQATTKINSFMIPSLFGEAQNAIQLLSYRRPNASQSSSTFTISDISQSVEVTPAAIAGVTLRV
jgi:hypothetical protein